MNLSKFLSSVDTFSASMDENQLIAFVHDIARVLPENGRVDFLERMKSNMDSLDKEKEYKRSDKKKYEDIKEKLEKIEHCEICLSGKLNEEYDDWYYSDEEEFLFEDLEGIGKIIESAYHFIHEAIDEQLFKEGNEIAEILIGLKIMVGGEYQDYSDSPLDIDELSRYHLVAIDYQKLVVESLYLSYQANPLEERANALYIILHNAKFKDISFEMIMQCGDELPEFEEFLPKWIAYLGNQNTSFAQALLDEALNLADDADKLLESARAFYKQHPGLYEKYIKENQDIICSESLILIGKEALEKINSKYLVRSRIALQLANLVLKENGKVTDEVEQYWLEAFRSDTRAVHFLRMIMESCDISIWKKKLQEINHNLIKKSKKEASYTYSCSTDLRENVPNINHTYFIALLNGEYQFVKEQGMNVQGALGWSFSYMKNGLATFLLLLFNSETLPEGMSAMLSKIVLSVSFSASEYGESTLNHITETDSELFWKCLLQSKLQNPMTESEQESFLEWVERLVRKRVDGIMEGSHRKYYDECAEYIAALGEVMESRGIINGKQRLMLEYKQCYSRRSAFHRELRNYGMKDKSK